MIIKCPSCDGKMRVDETRIPRGDRVKVRCPHCSEVSAVGGATPPDPAARIAGSASGPRQPVASTNACEAQASNSGPRPAATDRELCFPQDAFQNFRFPAETEIPAASKKKASSKVRLLVWVVVSLVIIALFALLVNLVLPGPHGAKPFGQPDKVEQRLPNTPGGSGLR